jgi:hypothetical protein
VEHIAHVLLRRRSQARHGPGLRLEARLHMQGFPETLVDSFGNIRGVCAGDQGMGPSPPEAPAKILQDQPEHLAIDDVGAPVLADRL